jgi:hypothetical protein
MHRVLLLQEVYASSTRMQPYMPRFCQGFCHSCAALLPQCMLHMHMRMHMHMHTCHERLNNTQPALAPDSTGH